MKQQEAYTWAHLCNTLECYDVAPAAWYDSNYTDLEAASAWIINILDGQLSAPRAYASRLSSLIMLPLADQLSDLANLIRYSEQLTIKPKNQWVWFAFLLSLLPQCPQVGRLLKGVLLLQFSRPQEVLVELDFTPQDEGPSWLEKTFPNVFKYTPIPPRGTDQIIEELWSHTQIDLERALSEVNCHLKHPHVIQALNTLHIDQPGRYFANQITLLTQALTPNLLDEVLNRLIEGATAVFQLLNKHSHSSKRRKINLWLACLADLQKQASTQWPSLLTLLPAYIERVAGTWIETAEGIDNKALRGANNEPHQPRTPKPEPPCDPLETLVQAIQEKFQ